MRETVIDVRNDQLYERDARVGGRNRSEERSDARPCSVSTDEDVSCDSGSVGKMDSIGRGWQWFSSDKVMVPLDGIGLERVEEYVSEVSSVEKKNYDMSKARMSSQPTDQSLAFRLLHDYPDRDLHVYHPRPRGPTTLSPSHPKFSSALLPSSRIPGISPAIRPPLMLTVRSPHASQESLLEFEQSVTFHVRRWYKGSSGAGGIERGGDRQDRHR